MPIRKGSGGNLSNIYLGSQAVQKVYKGSQQVWPTVPGGNTTITHGSITYTFQGSVTYGYYETGEPWVVAPAVLIGITPSQTVDQNSVMISGAQLNPQFNASSQGFDGRFSNFNSSDTLTFPANLVAGDVVVKAVGVNPTPTDAIGIRSGLHTDQSALFVRSSAPTGKRAAPAAFGWAGRGTPQDYPFDASVAVSALASYNTVAHNQVPSYNDLIAAIGKYNFGNTATSSPTWLGPAYGYEPLTVRGFSGPSSTNYGRYQASVIGAAGLALISNSFTTTQKTEILKSLVRFGIGLYDTHQGIGYAQGGNGGHFQFNLLPVSIALQYTGRSSALSTLATVYPTNHLSQVFVHTTQTAADSSNSHNSSTKQNHSRIRPIDSVSGNTITLTESGNPYWWNYKYLKMVRVSDGASAIVVSMGDMHLQGNFVIDAQPSTPFSAGDNVYFITQHDMQAGWVDWTLTSDSAIHEYNPSPNATYRGLNHFADDVLALKGMSIWDSSWDKLEKYVVLAQKDATAIGMYDYPIHTDSITLPGVSNWSQEFWNDYATSVGINTAYEQNSNAGSGGSPAVGGSAKFAQYNNVTASARVSPVKSGVYSLPMDPTQQTNFFDQGEAAFAIVRLPLRARRNIDLNAQWGVFGNDRDSWGYRLGLYDGENGLVARRHKFYGWYRGHGIAGGASVYSAPWLSDEALVVFQRVGNDFSIDLYELGTGTRTAGPITTATPYLSNINVNEIGVGGVAAIDTGTKDATGISGKAWPGEIAMFGHLLPAANATVAKWQSIAQGADPITVFGGANIRWLRKLDGSDASLNPIPAVTSDLTGIMTKGLNGQGAAGAIAGSTLGRKTQSTYLDVDLWHDGMVWGIKPGQTTQGVTFSGTAAGLTGTVEIRTIYAASGNVHQNWTTVGTISGGTWSGTVNLPKSNQGWLVAQFRATSDPTNITEAREEFGIGYVIGWLGQSQVNIAAHSTARGDTLTNLNDVTYVESLQTGAADATEGWRNAIYRGAPWQQADGLTYFVRQLRKFDTSTPIMVVNMAESGTHLEDLLDDSIQPRDWARLQSKLDEFSNAYSVVVMNWGTAMNSFTYQKNMDLMDALVNGTGPQYKGNSLKNSLETGYAFVVSPLTRHSDSTYDTPRRSQIEWANTNNVQVGPPIPDYRISNVGGPHPDSTKLKSNPVLGARMAMGAAKALGLTTIQNPYYDASAVVRSGNTITIPVIRPNGGTLSSPTPAALTNWQVNGSSTGFTAALSGNNVVLTKTTGNWAAGDAVSYIENGELRAANDGVAEDAIVNGVLYETWSDDVLGIGLPVVGSLSGGKWISVFSVTV